ncbi:MAG TPA: hypothetical protein VJZ71_20080 [Phycisphaerae bacterium]|nr:hypothetical protein [Phycisphaerae bacterium]
MNHPRFVSITLFPLLLFVTLCNGDVVLSTIVKGTDPVSQTSDVTILSLGSTQPMPCSAKMKLNVGDELQCAVEDIAVEVTCGERSESFRFSAPFRMLVTPGDNDTGKCTFDLRAGSADVIAESPTSITAGGVTMGSESTMYGVSVTRENDQTQIALSVYEGKVSFRSSPSAKPDFVEDGKKVLFAAAGLKRMDIPREDYSRAAQAYARIDLAKSGVAIDLDHGPVAGESPRDVFRALAHQYAQVLSNPEDVEVRLALAATQNKYNLSRGALYNLRRIEEPDRRSASVRDFLTASAYLKLNKKDDALHWYKMAMKNDGLIGEVEIQKYHIAPDEIKRLLPEGQADAPLIVNVGTTTPREFRADQVATLIVSVSTTKKEPVGDAEVIIKGEPPVELVGIRGATILGKTNAKGEFAVSWRCKRRSENCSFNIRVSKPGFSTNTQKRAVSVRW